MQNFIIRDNEFICDDLRLRCAIGKSGFSADKKEGDGCTPLGSLYLRECWYRADRFAAPKTDLPLRPITPRDGWCKDSSNQRYNRHVVLQLGDFNPYLQAPDRALRARMSDAQKVLWHNMRTPRFASYGFHRQYCMNGRYIIIVCKDKKLIVEADGEVHDDSMESRTRDAYLESEGFRILRFFSHAVMENVQAVLDRIEDALDVQSRAISKQVNEEADIFFSQNDDISRYERLWRSEPVYDIIVPLGYNDNPVIPGKGSAIFLHVAQENYGPTEGSVALALPDLMDVLQLCNPDTVIEIKEK